MTTSTTITQGQCISCHDGGPINYKSYCWRCIEVATAGGEGIDVGLPAVPADKIDAAIAWAASHIEQAAAQWPSLNSLTMFCTLLDDKCGECDTHVVDIDYSDDRHVIVSGYVMIGCEGFHTAAFRWAALNI